MQRCEGRDTEHADTGLWSAFSELGVRLGECAAILAPDRDTVTFANLASRIAAAKEQLNTLGIGRGDRLAIALPNGPDMAVCLLSAMACAIAVPLNPSSTGNEFKEYLRRVRPKALVVPAGVETPAQQAAREFGTSTITLVLDVSKPSKNFTFAGSHAGCTDSRWNTNDDVGVILLTSGSTSRQKLVPVKPRHQIAYARGINEIFRLGPADRSLLVMPLFHASGLNSSFLIPLLNGAAVVCLREFDGASFYRNMDAFKPTWITAGYAFLKAILDGVEKHQEIVQRARIRFIRSGTGRLQHAVKEGLEQAFRAPVLEQYSTTETGVIACSSMPPQQGKSGTAGRPIVNQVSIMGPDGAFLRGAREGEIMVRGPSVFDGYLDDPETNQASFIDGWYRTGDLGRLDADGFLTITGRATEIINRGGEKISPHEIETVMAGHTAIRNIKVFGIPHPTLGEEVVAAVILRSKSSVNEAALKAFAGERLAKFKLPRRIFFRDSFPLGSSKKLDIRKLVQECEQELNAERSNATLMPERVLSPTEKRVRDRVRDLWARVLGTDRVGLDENFFLLGGDSLKALELLVLIETVFGIEVPAEAMTGRAGTVSGMAAEIERRSSSRERHKVGQHREHVLQSPTGIPAWQQAIRQKCRHSGGTINEFRKEDTEQSIPDRFERMVQMDPKRLAVKTSHSQLTYEELNGGANRVAHAIMAQSGRHAESIAVLSGNTTAAVTAILGILKSANFYVPLDPLFPEARIGYMLDDCEAKLLLTTSQDLPLAQRLARRNAVQILNVSEIATDLSSGNPRLSIPADSLAYILYTSGSSRHPKGVTENHRNLLHEVMRLTNDFGICPEDRITLLNTLSFSGAARSIYGSLLNGASLFPYDIRTRGLARLAGWMIDEAITIYRSGPTLFRQFAQTLTGHEAFPALRLVAMGGEPVLKSDVDLYKKHFSEHCILVNGLRITETGTVSQYFVDKSTEVSEARLPVGYPAPDMTVLLLDDNRSALGRNEMGEIAVRSRYLFPEYWKNPALTNARFLATDDAEERIYLTGDLGIMRPDGSLIHLGRKDFQTKIRDQSVDPTEVEQALLNLDTVQAAAVEPRLSASGQLRLVAYVVLRYHASQTATALRGALSDSLPDYMIPSRYVFLDVLPLTPTGKVDRRALPEPDAARPALDTPYVAPGTPVEEKLAKVWAGVLGLDTVGVHDGFMDLGGDSLKAVELRVIIEREFSVELPMEAMHGGRATVSRMAATIERFQAGRQESWTDTPAASTSNTVPSVNARAAFCIDDLMTLLTFSGLAPIAWLLPYKRWRSVCNGLARAHVALKRLPAESLKEALVRLGAALACEEAQQRLLTAVYEDIVMTMREQLPIAWHPDIRLLGVEHITSALAAGHGAILWSCPTPFGGLISKKALKSAGIDIVHLRSDIHPYSSSWFGMKILNPLRTHVEDRYVAGTVIASEGDTLSALDQLLRHLQANAVVAIAANGSEGKPFEMPFLGGTLKLSLGAPTLAALHGAPLLPVFTSAIAPGEFEVVIEPPVKPAARPLAGETARELASSYARILESYLQRHPAEWRGWFMRNTWNPGSSL